MRALRIAAVIGAALMAGAAASPAARAATESPLPAPGAAATSSPAATPGASVDVETGAAHESLTNGSPAWDSQFVTVTQRLSPRRVFYGGAEITNRFNQQDAQFTAGAYVPLSSAWEGYAETSVSPTHHILPALSVTAGAQYGSASHWFEGLAVRHTEYDVASVNSGIFSLEHYWGNLRFEYRLTAAQLAGTGTDVEHAFRLDRYYGESNSFVGLGFAVGREVENVGLPTLLTSHVEGWSVLGRHAMGRRWAIVYMLETFQQGNSYTRTGGRLGLDYRF